MRDEAGNLHLNCFFHYSIYTERVKELITYNKQGYQYNEKNTGFESSQRLYWLCYYRAVRLSTIPAHVSMKSYVCGYGTLSSYVAGRLQQKKDRS
jgi:hypothetical protein